MTLINFIMLYVAMFLFAGFVINDTVVTVMAVIAGLLLATARVSRSVDVVRRVRDLLGNMVPDKSVFMFRNLKSQTVYVCPRVLLVLDAPVPAVWAAVCKHSMFRKSR